MKIARLLVLGACLPLWACASLTPHKLWAPETTAECLKSVENEARLRTCAAVKQLTDRGKYYEERTSKIGGERAALDAFSVVALIATAGFSVFDAHPDNVKAGALAAATGTGLGRALNTEKRTASYQLAFDRMACLRLAALPFTHPEADRVYEAATSGRQLSRLKDAIETAVQFQKEADLQRGQLGAMLEYGLRPGPDSKIDQALKGKSDKELALLKAKQDTVSADLTTAIKNGRASLDAGQAGAGSINRAGDLLLTESAKVEKDLAKGLADNPIDITKLIDLITADYKASIDAAKKLAGIKMTTGQSSEAMSVKDAAGALLEIKSATEAVDALEPKKYSDASKTISACTVAAAKAAP